jgi:hypothetical protein
MSEAPKRIWAEPGLPGYLDEPHEIFTVEYTRTDLVRAQIEAAVKRALEGAANEIDCGGCSGQCLDPANCHAKDAECIRAIDPAQFVEGDKT